MCPALSLLSLERKAGHAFKGVARQSRYVRTAYEVLVVVVDYLEYTIVYVVPDA